MEGGEEGREIGREGGNYRKMFNRQSARLQVRRLTRGGRGRKGGVMV